eukprot:TRINITY_DN64980_c0_g1_i1.p1 TRINITY_DN64980_c0_g1~~TRINITY_DN64980_c0_g1_i1.p1  ORF type:complete len:326 (+),score=106.93 TRINITY_DN64980_c0_g1_i1:105-980(+)
MPGALPPHLESLAEALSGAAGALLSSTSLYPLEMLKQQLAMAQSGTTIAEVIRRVGGVRGLYRGASYKALQVVIAKFLYFFSFSALSASVQLKRRGALAQLAVGYASDWCATPITLPIESLITKVQAASKTAPTSLLEVLRRTAAAEGLLSLYGGLKWQALVSLMPAVQQTIYNRLRAVRLRGRSHISPNEAFILGAVARLCALVLVFPFMKIKTMVQAAGGSATAPSPLAIVREEGVSALYAGFIPEAVRGVLSSAVLYMVKEALSDQMRQLLRPRRRPSMGVDDDHGKL